MPTTSHGPTILRPGVSIRPATDRRQIRRRYVSLVGGAARKPSAVGGRQDTAGLVNLMGILMNELISHSVTRWSLPIVIFWTIYGVFKLIDDNVSPDVKKSLSEFLKTIAMNAISACSLAL